MNEQRAFDMGRRAARRGDDRLSCPFPAPYAPPRTSADAEPDVAAGLTEGAFWLDGYEQELAGELMIHGGIKLLYSTAVGSCYMRRQRR